LYKANFAAYMGRTVEWAKFWWRNGGAADDVDVNLYGVLKNWGEMTCTWNKYDGVNVWATPGMGAGTDRDTLATSTVHVTALAWYEMDVKALVQAWLGGSRSNYGHVVNVDYASSFLVDMEARNAPSGYYPYYQIALF
jgi:hypothetical protein